MGGRVPIGGRTVRGGDGLTTCAVDANVVVHNEMKRIDDKRRETE